MEIRNLGTSGLRVSLVGLGCNNFGGRLDLTATQRVVGRALDAGIPLFDTADSYGNRGGSESQLGEALTAPKAIVLATKFASPIADNARDRHRGATSCRRWKRVRPAEDGLDLTSRTGPDPQTPWKRRCARSTTCSGQRSATSAART
jgi:aryl-alcohol dehydrogenase-like predicted oxidoreductase